MSSDDESDIEEEREYSLRYEEDEYLYSMEEYIKEKCLESEDKMTLVNYWLDRATFSTELHELEFLCSVCHTIILPR